MALAELQTILPTAHFDFRYATPNNVTGKVLYRNNPPRLEEIAARQLAFANKIINSKGLLLVIYDALRTPEAHEELLKISDDPGYVDPFSGHITGWSVDGTLAKRQGNGIVELDMGTNFDEFVPKSHVGAVDLSPLQQINRNIFAGIMAQAGFKQNPQEWWHFDSVHKPLF